MSRTLSFAELAIVFTCIAIAIAAAQEQTSLPSAKLSARKCSQNVAGVFKRGEQALGRGSLDEAEEAFRYVTGCDPRSAAGFANLAVVFIRKSQWTHAESMLRSALRRDPRMWGLRLNLGLVYYRQEQYANALPEFELALKLNAKSTQARYLLGLCDFYTQRYRETVQVLQPLWQTRTNDFVYMYVLGTSASQVGMTELEDRAFLQLAKLGTDTAEFHLLIGRAYLNRFEPDKAAVEFEQAATLKPDLPLLHFNLGVAYLRQHQYARAEEELKEEIKLEPEVAYAYDQLGLTYERMERPDEAERI
jgi:tetratricopeptide (TPR) repeat protein